MAPFVHNGSLIYYNDIIKYMGDFSGIQIPARCTARIGQAFADTRDAMTFTPGIVERNGRLFSGGVGTISQEALEGIWGKLSSSRMMPTALQIWHQGMYVSCIPGTARLVYAR